MRQPCSLLLILAAWFLATGTQWDVLQTFAWGRMFIGYAQTMPLTKAIGTTFDADNACELCVVVQQAKQQEPEHGLPGAALTKQLPFDLAPATPLVLSALVPVAQLWAPAAAPGTARARPPVPPPRTAAA